MAKRYELSDAQWARIAGLLPGKKGDRGRTAKDNRIFVDGVLWVLRSGARWSDLPERYGKWKSVLSVVRDFETGGGLNQERVWRIMVDVTRLVCGEATDGFGWSCV